MYKNILIPDNSLFIIFLFCVVSVKLPFFFVYIITVILPYIYMVFIRGYFVKKDFMLDEIILPIQFKCITKNHFITRKVTQNTLENYCIDYKKDNTNQFYVSSEYNSKLRYFGVFNPLTTCEIYDYTLWSHVQVGKMYRLKYYKNDSQKIILDIQEFKYRDILDKYLCIDTSGIVCDYI